MGMMEMEDESNEAYVRTQGIGMTSAPSNGSTSSNNAVVGPTRRVARDRRSFIVVGCLDAQYNYDINVSQQAERLKNMKKISRYSEIFMYRRIMLLIVP